MYMNHKERLAKKNRQEKTWDYAYPYWLKSSIKRILSTAIEKRMKKKKQHGCHAAPGADDD